MYDLETRYRSVVHYNYFQRSLRAVSKIYGVSKSSLQRWVKHSSSLKKARRKTSIKDDVRKCIISQLKHNPFITMDELANKIAIDCNIKRSRRTVNRYVKSEGNSFKTAFRMVNVDHKNEVVKQFCQRYIKACDDDSIISIDETGFYLGDHRKKGWTTKGKRLAIKSDKSLRRVKFTLILAISSKGLVGYEILDHNCKKVDFVTFIQNLQLPNGSVVCSSILYCIAYSPKLNCVENVFGMLKPFYRRMCPPEFNKSFDYKYLFENLLYEELYEKSLLNYFQHIS